MLNALRAVQPEGEVVRRDPWSLGRELGARGDALPDPVTIARRWNLTPRQVALFSFGHAAGVGYRYPRGFREHAEWLFREPDPKFDEFVLAIFKQAVGTLDDGSVIFPSDFTPSWAAKPH